VSDPKRPQTKEEYEARQRDLYTLRTWARQMTRGWELILDHRWEALKRTCALFGRSAELPSDDTGFVEMDQDVLRDVIDDVEFEPLPR
jgi:hypothetical protein